MNLQLNFSYFNHENLRINASIQFSNQDNMTAEEVEFILRQHMIMGQYFIPAEWMPVSATLADDEILAEFESLDTTSSVDAVGSVDDLLKRIYGGQPLIQDVRKAA
jgi:hypothetical protein